MAHWQVRVPIAKLDDDQCIAFGKASTVTDAQGVVEIFDHHGHAIPVHEIEQAAYEHVLKHGDVSDAHKVLGKGKLIESVVMTKEKRVLQGLPEGPVYWWVGHKLDKAFFNEKVKSGVYKELSIGGSGYLDDVPGHPGKKRVRALKIREIGYVPHGAGIDVPVSLWKSLEEDETMPKTAAELAVIIKQAQTLKKMAPDMVAALKKEGIDIAAKLDEILSKLPDEERAVVEMALAAAQGNAAPPPAPAPAPAPEGEMEKALKKARDDERTKLEKEYGDKIANLEKVNKRREVIAKATTIPHVPGDEKYKADLIEKNFDDPKFMEWLGSVNAALEKSDILGENGSSGGSDSTPLGQIEALTKQLREKDPALSYEVAFSKACDIRKDLYAKIS